LLPSPADDCQERPAGKEVVQTAPYGFYDWVPRAAGFFVFKCTIGGEAAGMCSQGGMKVRVRVVC
jgi:hypothetical protein